MMMSRRKRNWHPAGRFHIVMRGNNRSRIFCTPEDMAAFIAVIDECRERYRFTIIAYCVMTNHYHLLIKSPDVPLDKIMARINRRYSDYYSKKYLHVGRIYEKRYYSKEAEGPFAILAVSSYIHRNPIDTRKPMVENLIDYPYSSFPMYGSEDSSPKSWIDLDLLPTLLPVGLEPSRHNYSLYCQLYRQATEEDKKLNLLLSDDAWL